MEYLGEGAIQNIVGIVPVGKASKTRKETFSCVVVVNRLLEQN